MAVTTTNIPYQLSSNKNIGVADASQIAYSYKTVGEGDDAYEIIDKNLRLKIEELDSVDSQTLLQYTTRAETAARTSTELQENITNAIVTAKQDINDSISGTKTKLDNIDLIARSLLASLDVGAQIVVISKSAYDALDDKQGLIYFVYDENDAYVDRGQTIYSFTSWNDEGTTQYGSGTVITTGKYTNNKTEIVVVTNTDSSWVGRKFFVLNNASTDGNTLVKLYDNSEVQIPGVSVKITKVKDV